MLYRFFDCGIYDSNREERGVTVWIDAPSAKAAGTKIYDLLALTWDVSRDQVYIGGAGSSEFEIKDNSPQPAAGDRCLAECGSLGFEFPLYDTCDRLVFLDAKGRARLAAAFAQARAHAAELVLVMQAKADEARAQGNASMQKSWEYSAQDYARFVELGG